MQLSGSAQFSIKSWPFFYRQAYAKLQPGGWVENQEFDLMFGCDDGSLPADSAMQRWGKLWNEGIQKFGLTGRCDPAEMRAQMAAVGFTNISTRFIRAPVGDWPQNKQLRKSGLFSVVGLIEGLAGLSQRVFVNGLEWSIRE